MSGPNVTFNPNDGDGRVIYLTSRGHVTRWTLMEAQAARVRLSNVIAVAERSMQADGPQMTEYQRRHLHALLGELGLKGDARFPALTEILGREIGSTNEIPPVEADKAIEALRTRVQRARAKDREGAF